MAEVINTKNVHNEAIGFNRTFRVSMEILHIEIMNSQRSDKKARGSKECTRIYSYYVTNKTLRKSIPG